MGDSKRRLVLAVSGKGGVGKTTFAKLLTDLYHAAGTKADIYDADGQVGGLARVYYDVGVNFYDLRQDSDRATLLDSIDTSSNVILHDLPGGSRFEISKILDDGDGASVAKFVEILGENGARLTLVHLVDNGIEAAQSVGQYLDVFGTDDVDHVAVLNMRESKSSADFPYWSGYEVDGVRKYGKARDRLLAAGGVEIAMPGLHVVARAKVDAMNLKYSDCARQRDLTLTERALVSQFVKGFGKAVEPAKPLLGLA
ncbi:hypothetical protein HLH33_00570 [Gluconacetobacter diazotrophicus]|uniref:CobQ/CobB/MinD/ParA nucleotide binding domain-containing protein n=1 Tax=Gluconacetobacter diazotrophicus TaxID=33996 RepID=A0A7W4FC02_GLUDI|nr:hypothetical protein [Gluconacetobacter diazotrophicus]MBB2154814.1 hypothetical protein [Gluconacetobacter diazotrophicus]